MIIQIIDPGKRVFVLDGDQIDRSVIHNHSICSILLLDEEDGASPRRGTRMDETFFKDSSS